MPELSARVGLEVDSVRRTLAGLRASIGKLRPSLPSAVKRGGILSFVGGLGTLGERLRRIARTCGSMLLRGRRAAQRSIRFLSRSSQLLSEKVRKRANEEVP